MKTKREAVVTAIEELNHCRRMAELIRYSGTFTSLMTNDEIEALEARRRRHWTVREKKRS